ncbi:MAG: hypothetical protein N2170_04955, partial [Bacteroidia bacterium]|nr:hypothetical protein [Bacteroidia bacterium]
LKVYAQSGEQTTPGGDELAQKYGIDAFPTFLVCSASGETFYREEGVPLSREDFSSGDVSTPEAIREALLRGFERQMESAKKAQAELPQFRKKFAQGERSLSFLRDYLRLASQLHLSTEVDTVFAAYTRAAGSVRKAWGEEPELLGVLGTLASMKPRYQAYAWEILDSLTAAIPDTSQLLALYEEVSSYEMATLSQKVGKNPSALADTLEALLRRSEKSFPALAHQLTPQIATLLLPLSQKDPRITERAFRLALQAGASLISIPGGHHSSEESKSAQTHISYQLNSLAWACYESMTDPDKLWVAVGWARYALTLNPESWQIWDTLGALYLKLKRKRDALMALDKAVTLAQKQGTPEREYQGTVELRREAAALPD